MTETKISSGAKFLSAISYIWILWIIPFIFGVRNNFIKNHAKQGALLFVCEIIGLIIMAIPVIGWLIGLLIWVFCLVIAIIGIVKSIQGKSWEVPWIGKLVRRF